MQRILSILALILMSCAPVEDEGVMPGITSIEQELPIEGHCDPGDTTCPCPPSPILLDMDGDGWDLTNAANGVVFDIYPGGSPEAIAWTTASSDDSWLVLDENGNGKIDDGSEMFGNYTSQPDIYSPNGFAALAVHDTNHDNKITSADAVFTRLRLWRDSNHDAVTQPAELSTLASKGITGLSTLYTEQKFADAYGNTFRYKASVLKAPLSTVNPLAFDVFLVSVEAAAKAEELGLKDKSYLVAPAVVCLLNTPTKGCRADCWVKYNLPDGHPGGNQTDRQRCRTGKVGMKLSQWSWASPNPLERLVWPTNLRQLAWTGSTMISDATLMQSAMDECGRNRVDLSNWCIPTNAWGVVNNPVPFDSGPAPNACLTGQSVANVTQRLYLLPDSP